MPEKQFVKVEYIRIRDNQKQVAEVPKETFDLACQLIAMNRFILSIKALQDSMDLPPAESIYIHSAIKRHVDSGKGWTKPDRALVNKAMGVVDESLVKPRDNAALKLVEYVRMLIEEGRIAWKDDAPILEEILENVEYFCSSQDA
jgi:hypothetical protein